MATIQESYTAGEDSDVEINADVNSVSAQAMVFTIGTTGNNLTFDPTSVEVRLKKTGVTPNDVTITIQDTNPDNSPNGNIKATGTLAKGDVTTAQKWFNVVMSTTESCVANGVYALVLSSAGTDATHKYQIATDMGGGYAGGNAFEFQDPDWTDNAPVDMLFVIKGGEYSGTLCTLADAVNKAGANVSAGGSEEGLVSDFVRQAEGTIAAVTKFDWVDAYASISDDVKYILNDVASNLAAIYIISYDMSGYTADTVEAETMINVYRESIARGLSLLKDQEVKDFITGDA